MTNRERAIDIWRKLTASDEKPEDWPEEWEHIERALDAAELRGKIAGLEFAVDELASAPFSADPADAIRAELDRCRTAALHRLRAELAKGQGRMTNREKAIELLRWLGRGAGDDEERIESALNSERKAGELDGEIRALEWVIKPACYAPSTVRAELDRLRAEKAKLG